MAVKKKTNHVTVKIPKELIAEMDKLKGKHGFRSRGEIAKEAIRKLLKEYAPFLSVLEHFNLNEDGVIIADRSNPKGVQLCQIWFKPEGIQCEECGTDDCKHVRFALSHPPIQEVIRKRRLEGWKLPEV